MAPSREVIYSAPRRRRPAIEQDRKAQPRPLKKWTGISAKKWSLYQTSFDGRVSLA